MIDIVILSCSANEELKKQTSDCLDSLFVSEDNSEDLFNVIVLESESSINWDSYPNTKTYKSPEPYGYHKYMNYGRKLGTNQYVCLCNNDLIFRKNWASNILELSNAHPHILSFSPICPKTQPMYGILVDSENYLGYEVRKQISGWCIFQKREIYDIIGDLDERFTHWFSDNDYALTLKSHGIKHCLVTYSVVEHHDKNVGKTGPAVLSEREMYDATSGSQNIFVNKWGSYLSAGNI
jgi:GT2 family glycosyltransferase